MIEIKEFVDAQGTSPFGREGTALVVLLGGGTKVRQQRDIDVAVRLWREYKRRKRQED